MCLIKFKVVINQNIQKFNTYLEYIIVQQLFTLCAIMALYKI